MTMYFTSNWWAEARCGGRDPHLWERSNNTALAICAECPVRAMCEELVMESPWEPYGIWGGKLQIELRRQWRKRHPRASRAEVEALMGVIA